MPVVKVSDIAFARLQSPDLDRAEQFRLDFGMVRAARTPTALYMRGTGPSHHIHVTQLGGGQRVRVRDPHGYEMEAIYGMKKLKPLLTRAVTRKAGELLRIKPGASQVVPRNVWLHSVRRGLRRSEGEHHRDVQPLRPRRKTRRSPHVPLLRGREGRPEPSRVRSAELRRSDARQPSSAGERQIRARLGRRPAPARQKCSTTGGSMGPSTGSTPTGSRLAAAGIGARIALTAVGHASP